MDALTYLAVAAAAGAGAWLGWRFRGMRHLTERRVLEEIYTRKTRLAESQTRTVTSLIALYKALGGGWDAAAAAK